MKTTLDINDKLLANAIPDAWLVAAVIQLGEHLITFDTDSKKTAGARTGDRVDRRLDVIRGARWEAQLKLNRGRYFFEH